MLHVQSASREESVTQASSIAFASSPADDTTDFGREQHGEQPTRDAQLPLESKASPSSTKPVQTFEVTVMTKDESPTVAETPRPLFDISVTTDGPATASARPGQADSV